MLEFSERPWGSYQVLHSTPLAQYGDLLDAWLIADSDDEQVSAVTNLGIKCESAPLLMTNDLAAKEIAVRAMAMVR